MSISWSTSRKDEEDLLCASGNDSDHAQVKRMLRSLFPHLRVQDWLFPG